MEFEFIRARSFIIPTDLHAKSMKEFAELLGKVTTRSIYFHIFEAKLRLERGVNDFSFWIGTSADAPELAKRISELDPYTFNMENLRHKIIRMITQWCNNG